jgi:hypothetical protein
MTNQIRHYINYLFDECYQEDYNPFYAEFWYDNYCYHYTFSEWYFLLRKRLNYNYNYSNIGTKINNYQHTPAELIIRKSFY